MARSTKRIETIYGPMHGFTDDLITEHLEDFGAHQRNEIAMLRDFVRPGDVVVDVGANIGTIAIPLALRAGETGRVYAFEADAETCALLERNITENGLGSKVIPTRAIVSARKRRFMKVTPVGNVGATSLLDDEAARAGKRRTTRSFRSFLSGLLGPLRRRLAGPSGVPMMEAAPEEISGTVLGLDEWYETGGPAPDRVDLIKIDVEGMDAEVLESAREIIRRHRPVIYIEVAKRELARAGRRREDIAAVLQEFDYHYFRNVGERNSTHDRYCLGKLRSLRMGGPFYDLLAVPPSSPRYPAEFRGHFRMTLWSFRQTLFRISAFSRAVARRLVAR